MGETSGAYQVWGAEDLTEEGNLQDLGVDGRTILKLIFKK